ASRTPVHLAGSTGGMKRFLPAVLAPYGMPLKVLMPPASTPRTRPNVVSASTLDCACAHVGRRMPPADSAASTELCFRNARRDVAKSINPPFRSLLCTPGGVTVILPRTAPATAELRAWR